ncbi:MAG: phosphatase PAP2 family protein [Acidobacteria bacterium]|nr:phosphatase PAP2 family protein [Acidobacteriota bacterium]MBV9624439.1 phosphatase PAP2 family protein [Acidobacteriota bacterium]
MKSALRIGEWIQLVFIGLLGLGAWFRPLEAGRRKHVTLLALAATAAIAAARFSGRWMSPLSSSVVRDWIPAATMLVPYWQVGQFFTASNPALEARLAHFDSAFFRRVGIEPARAKISVAAATYLQLAYLMDYPLVPLALVVLYTIRLRSKVDFYWLVVLVATYVCFGLTLFIRALPPRMLPGYEKFQVPSTRIGALNRVLLDRFSIQAITCPSAHVASSLAAALVLLRLEPWAGAIFLCLALSIAAATIIGGYHYVADVLSAMGIALIVFAMTSCIYALNRL